jgi:hypothetical protein
MMTISAPHSYTLVKDTEKAHRAAFLYEAIRDQLSPMIRGQFLLIDLVTGDYEVGRDDIAAEERLLQRHPQADIYMMAMDGGPAGQITWE